LPVYARGSSAFSFRRLYSRQTRATPFLLPSFAFLWLPYDRNEPARNP